MAPSKKEIQIVKMNPPQLREEEAVVDSKVPKETTVPLAVQPKNIRDTAEISTPHSKKKQVIIWSYSFLNSMENQIDIFSISFEEIIV